MNFTFYKDNRLDGEHIKTETEIIAEYALSPISEYEMPFERKILNFMMTEYGSFDTLTESQWDVLYTARLLLKQ